MEPPSKFIRLKNHFEPLKIDVGKIKSLDNQVEKCEEIAEQYMNKGQDEYLNITCQKKSVDENGIHVLKSCGQIGLIRRRRISEFQQGSVVHGDHLQLLSLLRQQKLLTVGTHGVITSHSLNPSLSSGNYSEGLQEQFEVIKDLGKGSYGKVQLCRDGLSQKQFIRKEIFKGFKINEVLLLEQITHPNITKLHGFIQRNETPEILMEYAGVSLLRFTLSSPCTNILYQDNDELIRTFTKQGLSAFEYLDNRGILHLDVKPSNFCIMGKSDEYVMKLTDFGSAKTPQDLLSFDGWTPEYMSPEACLAFTRTRYSEKIPYNPEYEMTGKSDVFSFGLIILFMYHKGHILLRYFTKGKSSYKDDVERQQTQINILLTLMKNPNIVHQQMIPVHCYPPMKHLLRDLLQGYPKDRPSAFEALDTIQGLPITHPLIFEHQDDIEID